MSITNDREYTDYFTQGYDSGQYQPCIKTIGGSVSLTKFDLKNITLENTIVLEFGFLKT